MSDSSGLSRAQIAVIISQAHGPFLMHLESYDCVKTLSNQASMYGILGFKRKEAFLMREVLAALMDMIASGREETLSVGNIGLGVPILSKSNATSPAEMTSPGVGFREYDNTDGNQSIIKVVQHVCSVYGVDLTSLNIMEGEEVESLKELDQGSFSLGNMTHGWSELQVVAVREAVKIAEALPGVRISLLSLRILLTPYVSDYGAVAQFSLSTLRAIYQVLGTEDQDYLYATAMRSLDTTRRRGQPKYVASWIDNPIVDISVNPYVLLGSNQPASPLMFTQIVRPTLRS
jgi:hypothetical protein